jgi:hypothetical protein
VEIKRDGVAARFLPGVRTFRQNLEPHRVRWRPPPSLCDEPDELVVRRSFVGMVDTTVDEIAALRRSESSVFAVSNSTGDMSPMGSRSRVVFHQRGELDVLAHGRCGRHGCRWREIRRSGTVTTHGHPHELTPIQRPDGLWVRR